MEDLALPRETLIDRLEVSCRHLPGGDSSYGCAQGSEADSHLQEGLDLYLYSGCTR